MPKCIILSGIPCSGKSTFTSKYKIPKISCDDIRLELFGKKYKHNNADEAQVWDTFDHLISIQTKDFMIDNTNTKKSYINHVIRSLPKGYTYQIKFFDVPLWKAKFRNILRYISIGKWVPMKVIESMYKNYNKINKKDYAEYLFHE